MKKRVKRDEDSCWAIASVLAAAVDGDRDAQCAAGERFWYGDLVRRDLAQAVYWYTQAAKRGHTHAQCCLAYAYALGEGVEKDPAKAVYWYTQATHQGDFIATRALAACYAMGFGVEKDPMQAYALACDAILQYRRPPCTTEGFDRP